MLGERMMGWVLLRRGARCGPLGEFASSMRESREAEIPALWCRETGVVYDLFLRMGSDGGR